MNSTIILILVLSGVVTLLLTVILTFIFNAKLIIANIALGNELYDEKLRLGSTEGALKREESKYETLHKEYLELYNGSRRESLSLKKIRENLTPILEDIVSLSGYNSNHTTLDSEIEEHRVIELDIEVGDGQKYAKIKSLNTDAEIIRRYDKLYVIERTFKKSRNNDKS